MPLGLYVRCDYLGSAYGWIYLPIALAFYLRVIRMGQRVSILLHALVVEWPVWCQAAQACLMTHEGGYARLLHGSCFIVAHGTLMHLTMLSRYVHVFLYCAGGDVQRIRARALTIVVYIT